MYGVVLWSDPDVSKAVIWCEDHGDLAFYEGQGALSLTIGRFPESGDYVSFDVDVRDDVRIVSNPTPVASGTHPGLAQSLRADRDVTQIRTAESRSPSAGSNLVSLSDYRTSAQAEPHTMCITHHG